MDREGRERGRKRVRRKEGSKEGRGGKIEKRENVERKGRRQKREGSFKGGLEVP